MGEMTAEKLARKIKSRMRLGKSLSQASKEAWLKGYPPELVERAILLVDTGSKPVRKRRVRSVFSGGLVFVLSVVLAALVIAWYSSQGNAEAGVLLVVGYWVVFLILSGVLFALFQVMTPSKVVNPFSSALLAVLISELASEILLFSAGDLELSGKLFMVLLTVLFRHASYTIFLVGGSPARYLALAVFFTIGSLIARDLVFNLIESLV